MAQGLTDAFAVTLRFALYVDLMVLFGLPLFGLYALKGGERGVGGPVAFRPAIVSLSVAAVGLSIVAFVVMTASMAGVAITDVDSASLKTMIADTPMGHAWAVRIAALALALFAGLALKRRETRAGLGLATLPGGVALATLAWTGHGAAGEGLAGAVQLVADIVHLAAAGAWVGALAGLGVLVCRAAAADDVALAHRALDGFALVGTIIVGLIVATGAINGYLLVGPGHVLALPSSLYGRLLLAKLTLFGVMLGLAAANRYRHTPALHAAIRDGGTDQAVRALRRSLAVEGGAAAAILGLVAWLGTLAPPMSA